MNFFRRVLDAKFLSMAPHNAFILGFFYAIIGSVTAYMVFPSNAGMMAVIFTATLAWPLLFKAINFENVEIDRNRLGFIRMFKDHKMIFQLYFFLFMGVLVAFGILSVLLPELTVTKLFNPQLAIAGLGGAATASGLDFGYIVTNNLKVLVAFVIFSVVYGAGTVVFLLWNASVWGTIFGFVARLSAAAATRLPIVEFGFLMLRVLPHTALEVFSYFFAIVAGAIFAKTVIRPVLTDEQRTQLYKDAFMFLGISIALVFVGAYFEVYVFPVLGFIGG
ncbi:MAG: stage II sporulation protein M [archaeon]